MKLFNKLTGKWDIRWSGIGDAASVSDAQYATKITSSGGYTYIGEALPPGTTYANRAAHEAAAVWRVKRIDSSGSSSYADGNANFDNIATDLTALSFTV